MTRDVLTAVTRNRPLGHGNFLLEFEAAELARDVRPAQFFMIGIPGSQVLLRRAFSVCGIPGTFEDGPADHLQILYKVFGTGTSLMASLKAGAPLNVLGPLGNGFELPRDDRTPLFVAGGIGSAPFPALARRAKLAGRQPRMVYGARTRMDLPLLEWFDVECRDLVVTTDDGSLGEQGLVTAPLERLLDEGGPDRFHLYACGPEPMLRALRRLAVERGVRCDLALEARMACGFGVCLGCVVPTHGEGADGDRGYERVCVEGPVMRAERLAW